MARRVCKCGEDQRNKFNLRTGGLTFDGNPAGFYPNAGVEWENFSENAPVFKVLPWWCANCKTLMLEVFEVDGEIESLGVFKEG